MPKLYFRHGAVSSAKTLNLLAVAHNYKSQGKSVLLLKPEMDTRFGVDKIKSRAGLHQEADVLINASTNLLEDVTEEQRKVSCVLVDEAQFLSPYHVDQLRLMTVLWKVPVICFGLRTDFRANLFPGSKRLMELADSIEEVKTTCYFCNRKAVFNLKHVDGIADCTGPAVQLGAEEKYFPTCFDCYRESLLSASQMPVDAHWENPYEVSSLASTSSSSSPLPTSNSDAKLPPSPPSPTSVIDLAQGLEEAKEATRAP